MNAAMLLHSKDAMAVLTTKTTELCNTFNLRRLK